MREVLVVKRCDQCRAEATNSFTVGVVAKDSRPPLHTVDLCEDHSGMMQALMTLVADCAPYQRNGESPAIRSDARNSFPCPACERPLTTMGSLRNHIYQVHLGMETPQASLKCPECGREFANGQGAAAHRTSQHGHDMMAGAYQALRAAGFAVTV